MRRSTLLTLVSILTFAFSSCGKGDSDDNTPGTSTPTTATYYMSYKANGTTVTETEVTAVRGTSTSPRTLTITGNGTNGASPKFKFFAKETFIGFVPGLSIGNNSGTSDFSFVEYTNSAGLIHSTTLDKSSIGVGITELSYTNGGTVKGIFDGNIKAANGSAVAITEGKFNVKFSN